MRSMEKVHLGGGNKSSALFPTVAELYLIEPNRKSVICSNQGDRQRHRRMPLPSDHLVQITDSAFAQKGKHRDHKCRAYCLGCSPAIRIPSIGTDCPGPFLKLDSGPTRTLPGCHILNSTTEMKMGRASRE